MAQLDTVITSNYSSKFVFDSVRVQTFECKLDIQNYHFCGKFTKMITRVTFGFLRIHRIYDFCYFPQNGHSDNGYFCEKF